MADYFTDGEDSGDEQPALPPAYTDPAQARIAVSRSREARGQRRENFNETIQSARLENSINAQDLHEAQFGETVRRNDHQMSLEDSKLALDRAKLLQALVNKQAEIRKEYRKTLTAAAAVDYFSKLDPADKDFQKQYYNGMAKYAYALDQKPVQDVLAQKREDSATYDTAIQNKVASQFSSYGQRAYDQSIAEHADPELAINVAKGVDARYNKLKELYSHADASSEIRDALVNPKTGAANLDAVEGAELQVGQRKAERESQEKLTKDTAAIHEDAWNLLKGFNKDRPLDTSTFPFADKANRTPEEQTANNAAWNAFKTVTNGMTASPHTPVASIAPVTPATAAPTPAPAPSPSTATGDKDAVASAIKNFLSTGGQPQGPPPAPSVAVPADDQQ